MEVSPRTPRRIKESPCSSSSDLHGFINPDDRESRQVQDEISALERQQQLYDCEKEQLRLKEEIRVLQALVNDTGIRMQQLDDEMDIGITRLRRCSQDNENKERGSAKLKDVANDLVGHCESYEAEERQKMEEIQRLSAEYESLQSENTNVSIKLGKYDLMAKALSKDIGDLHMQLLEKSDCFLPIEKRDLSPASGSKHSASASSKLGKQGM